MKNELYVYRYIMKSLTYILNIVYIKTIIMKCIIEMNNLVLC